MKRKLFSLFVLLFVALSCCACDFYVPNNNNGSNNNNNNNNTNDDGDYIPPDYSDLMPLQLWYDEEAPKIKEGNGRGFMSSNNNQNINDDGWTNWSLPIGNGYFGVNVFGRTETERLQITDKTLTNPWQTNGGKYEEVGGLNNFSETYIDFNHINDDVENYKRYLDLRTAISGVEYDYDGVHYSREYFASYPDNAFVIYLDADKKGSLDFTLRPSIPFEKNYAYTAGDGYSKSGEVESWVEDEVGTIELSGKMNYFGIDFLAIYKVYIEGGEMEADTVSSVSRENQNGGSHSKVGDGTIVVSGATRAYIVVTLGTDYELNSGIFLGGQFDRNKSTQQTTMADTREKVEGYFENIEELTWGEDVDDAYEILKDRHLKDYQEIFGRVEFNLDVNEDDYNVTTDVLQLRASLGNSGLYLENLLFQYGRYLLIASSRPGTLPAHLQGAWNCYDTPPWSSGYWHNINVQMNYWPAFTTNLAETFDAYVDFNKAYMEQAEYLATSEVQQYNPEMLGKDGGNGWTVGVAGNAFFINGDRSPGNMGFTTQLFWDYYLYTKDEKVLKNTYEVLANAARYITKSVKPDANGKLLVDYCDSPEQHVNGVWYYTKGTTYAQTLSYLNNYYALEAAKELGIDIEDNGVLTSEEYSILNTILEQLDKYDPINVGLSGQVKEFREEEYYGDLGDPHHRHISQLVGLYPGNLINSNTPAWMDAADVTLEGRSGFNDKYGWVYSHKMALYARLKDAENAYAEYKKLTRNVLGQNLWTKYAEVYQAESNFGATAGIAEMLLQSHEGYIEPLAALPNAWAKGSYKGLVAQGNFEVSCDWENSLAKTIEIKSNVVEDVKVKYPSIVDAKIVDSKGKSVKYEVVDGTTISFATKAGETYTITGLTKVEKLNTPTNFEFTRNGLGAFNFTWDAVKGAIEYKIYKAVENAPTYTLINTTSSNSYTYTAPASESNLRQTFCVVAVGKDGIESRRATVQYVPLEVNAPVNGYDWAVTKDGGIEFIVYSNENAIKYCLYEKQAGESEFVKIAESSSNILKGNVYRKDSEYALQTISKIDNIESQLYVVDKNYNVAKNKQFEPTTTANGLIYNNEYGYNNLTDGVFAEFTGRFSTKVNNSSAEATLNLEQKYIVNEFRIYDYAQNVNYVGTDLKIDVYANGSWKTVVDLASTSEIGKHRVKAQDAKSYAYLAFDLGGVEVEQIRFKISNTVSGCSISFYEIEVMGYSEVPTDTSVINVFKGKQFTPTTEANANVFPGWDNYSFGYDKLTDAKFSELEGRFSTNINKDGASSSINATINLGADYALSEIRFYDYLQNVENAGADLKVEVYTNGAWKTVVNCTNSQFNSYRSSNYLSFNLENVLASQVRISSSGALNGKSTSFYEIECFGSVK